MSRKPLYSEGSKREHLDLFAGCGGFTLGLSRSNLDVSTTRICEKDPKALKTLELRYPEIPKTPNDIKELSYAPKTTRKPWIITGGFPCQDISGANPFGKGLKGSRSGLWFEFKRIIQETQPEWVIIENSPNLRTKGLGTVLKDLREIGYLGVYTIIGGQHLGSPMPHKRERIWIVAHPMRSVWRFQPQGNSEVLGQGGESPEKTERSPLSDKTGRSGEGTEALAHPNSEGREGGLSGREIAWGQTLLGCIGRCLSELEGRWRVAPPSPYQHSWEPPRLKPRLDRSSSRISSRVDRLRQIGNSVIPDIPEAIGNAIHLMENNATA